MSEGKYICIRATYYAHKRWEVGEELWEGLTPNKHFTIDGVIPSIEDDEIPLGPFDDTRSTDEIRADVVAMDMDPGESGRKELWSMWAERKKAELRATKPQTVTTIKPIESENKILKKNFKEWTPDDINEVSAKDICEKLKKEPYSTEAKPVGISKANLVAIGIKIETEQHMNAVG